MSDGVVALICLQRGITTLIDAADVARCSGMYWSFVQGRVRSQATTVEDRKRQHGVLLHRFLMDEPEGFEVDHRNLDQLDNRRDNLRKCIHAQNMRNRRINRVNSSGFKGVKLDRRTGKYVARINSHDSQIHLGVFDSAEAAARAYDTAALKEHGEFARFNFRGSINVC